MRGEGRSGGGLSFGPDADVNQPAGRAGSKILNEKEWKRKLGVC